jgi:hypothetical protein
MIWLLSYLVGLLLFLMDRIIIRFIKTTENGQKEEIFVPKIDDFAVY